MKKLKTILLYNASKYAHIAFILTFFILGTKYYYTIVLGFIYLIFVYRKTKYLCLIAFVLIMVIGIRYWQINHMQRESLPIQAEVIELDGNSLIVRSKNKYMVYVDDPNIYKPGMILNIKGRYTEIDQMHIEHNFNYTEYLTTQNILGIINPSQISIINQKWNIHLISYKIKNYFEDQYPEKVSTYMKLFILGHKDDLDESVINLSNNLGISHLFAISGMHLGLILLIINKILSLFYFKKQTYQMILIMFLLFYNSITGFSISIVRASLFFSIVLLSKESRYRFTASDYLSFIYVFFLIYNPYFIFALGFQLSFLMAYILILFKHYYIDKKGVRKIFYICYIAIIFSLPITLTINKSIGLLNVFINPIFIVYVSFILLPGAIVLLISPYLSQVYLYLIRAFEALMEYVMDYNVFIQFNFSNSYSKGVFWLIVIMSFLYYRHFKKRIIILWLIFSFLIFQTNLRHDDTKVVIFDVNQADATYIQTKDCKLLIDTGNADDYDTLINYFKGENIHELDAIILTHQHLDHYGEIQDILAAIKVNRVYVSREYDTFKQSIQKVVSEGDEITCGQTLFHVINGNQGLRNENNNSLVIYTNINQESWLFAADIEEEIEEKIIRKYHFKIDHLKVAHHGSNTSSISAFIEHFQPKNAYISVGKNSYGLPNEKVIENLNTKVENIYITKEIGSINIIYGKLYSYKYFYYNGKKGYEINLNI